MAPSSDDKSEIYSKLTLDELKTKCIERKLAFFDVSTKEQFIEILIEDDSKPPNWGKIYSRVLYHTGMNYEEIARRTIPQIMAILDGAEENISIKMGMPMFGSSQSPTTPQNNDKPPKVSQFADLANMFSGI